MGTLLNVVIGTVFVFLVFSLVVSAINELVTAVFAIRSKILWQTISNLAAPTTDKIPKLGLGRVLQLGFTASWLEKIPVLGPFAETWIDHRPKVTDTASSRASCFLSGLAERTTRFDSAKTGRPTRIKNVSPQVVSQVLLEFGGSLPTLVSTGGQVVAQGEAFLNTILTHTAVAGTHLEAPVTAAVARAQGDVDKFQKAIEEWFDARMTALSGLYKTWARWMMLGLGLAVAFTFSLNPIRTIDALRKDSALAQATADQAANFVAKVDPKADLCALSSSASTGGSTTPTTVPTSTSTPIVADQIANCYSSVQNAIARGRQLPPPLNFNRHLLFRGTQSWLTYILGCLLGAVALSFGAPFWFDALRKLISIRQ